VDDVDEFHALIHSSYEILAQADVIARAIHTDWYEHITEARRERGGAFCKPYDQLDDTCKATNIAAALRITTILGLISFELEKGTATVAEEEQIEQKLNDHLELLAEAEHMGWDEQTRLEGWVPGPDYNEGKKIHHLLVPYEELPEVEKKKDRDAVLNYPKNLRLAGFKIVPRRTEGSAA
jgi:hypothetical protein